MGKTLDEKLLLKIYEMGLDMDEPIDIDIMEVGREIGQNDRSIKTTVRDLAQANFIKKIDGNKVRITPNGVELAVKLLGK
jgi:Mn-dependent DtxR family transcriptional regulator